MSTEINIGDIWKWSSEGDYRLNHTEYWLITDRSSDSWVGLCLQGEGAGRTDEITVGETGYYSRNWVKVA